MSARRSPLARRKRALMLAVFTLVVVGCAPIGKRGYGAGETVPVVMWFDNFHEVFEGTGRSQDWLLPTSVDMKSRVGNSRCIGEARARIVPPRAEPPRRCDGVRGDAMLSCSDGRQIRVAWAAEETCQRGAGQGQDGEGHGVRLSFGGSRERSRVIAADAIAGGARLPKLPVPGERAASASRGPSTGTAFFVTWDGHLVTNHHVVRGARRIQVQLGDGELVEASLVRDDAENDLALLQVEAIRRPLSVESRSSVRRGGEVFTLGYPLITLQGQEQKATFGHVNSLTGMQGDERYAQIDVPIQPGNSGGPLIDTQGDVVGVVSSMLHPRVTLETIGVVPQNVNYAVKSDYVHQIMESGLPEGWKSERLPEKKRTYQELVEAAESSVVLVLAW